VGGTVSGLCLSLHALVLDDGDHTLEEVIQREGGGGTPMNMILAVVYRMLALSGDMGVTYGRAQGVCSLR
jgi:hypothetical protein